MAGAKICPRLVIRPIITIINCLPIILVSGKDAGFLKEHDSNNMENIKTHFNELTIFYQ